MLTMQTASNKERIIAEAARILKPGGQYAIHELCLKPDDLDDGTKSDIERALSEESHIGTRPQTSEWRELLEGAELQVSGAAMARFELQYPLRLLRDEGLFGTFRLVSNVLRDRAARRRLLAMQSIICRYRDSLSAVAFVAVKPE